MALTRVQKLITVEDVDGKLIPAAGAVVDVQVQSSGLLDLIYTDRDGATPKGNPITLGDDGMLVFYCYPKVLKLVATHASGTTTYPDFLGVDEKIIKGPQGAPQFSDVAAMKSATPLNSRPIAWADYLGRKVSTVVHNTTSNTGGADYVIVNVNPGNLSTLVGGIWVGANHDLGGGFYAKLILNGGAITAESCGAVADWNRTTRVGTDATQAIQSAINFAGTFVNVVSGVDPKGGIDVTLSGGTGNGQFRVTTGIRIAKSNIGIIFNGGASLATDFSAISGGSCAVLIFGTAENWLSTGTISSTTKYNRLHGCKISRTGGLSPIGVLSTGTRNFDIQRFHAEQVAFGLYLENTSELTGMQVATIGCTYGMVGDSRKNRTISQSPLGVANVDNDCSSCTINMFKAYYPQHTGLLLINSGTMNFYGGTIGRFSENPEAGPIRYELPLDPVGVHYYGANTNFSKGGVLDGFVFEAAGSGTEKTCIYLHSPANNNPIRGVTIRAAHVQTYDENHTTGVVTNLLKVGVFGGSVDRCSLRDSGFTPQTDGYFYGRLITSAEGSSNFCVDTKNIYPSAAISMSKASLSNLGDFNIIDDVNMEVLTGGVPTGWTLSAGAVVTSVGGASGVERSLRFDGNDTGLSFMHKTINYRNYISKTNVFYISLMYKGSVVPHINFIVNGTSDTARTTKSGANQARYSNAFYDYPQSDGFTRATYCFNFFSANFSFDNVKIEIGRGVAAAADFVEVKSVNIGYFIGFDDAYNTF